jgi:hypothetical protein
MHVPADTAEQIARDGYSVIRELLSGEEIGRLREAAAQYFATKPHARSNLGRNLPDAARFMPSIHWLYEHPNIVAAMRAALGSNHIVFTRHCDVHLNRLSGWHKDSNGYFTGDFFADAKLGVCKIGLYLEDHRERGGLMVRPATHHTPSLTQGTARHLETRAGDAIIFDVRLTHSGQQARLAERALLKASGLLPAAQRVRAAESIVQLKDLYWRLTGTPERYALFFTYGLNGERTAEFCRTTMARQARQNAAAGITEHGDDCSELAQRLAVKGVLTYGINWGGKAEVAHGGVDAGHRAAALGE